MTTSANFSFDDDDIQEEGGSSSSQQQVKKKRKSRSESSAVWFFIEKIANKSQPGTFTVICRYCDKIRYLFLKTEQKRILKIILKVVSSVLQKFKKQKEMLKKKQH